MIINHSSITMPEIENESVHAVITSPPYPMIQKWDECFEEQGAPVDFEQQHKILDRVWEECDRVLIPGGIMAINVGDATRSIDGNFQCYPNYARITMECCEWLKLNHLIPIFWKKISNRPNAFLGSGFLPVNAYVSQDCEFIMIFRKGSIRKFKKDEVQKRRDSAFTKEERDKWFSQIWEIQGEKGSGEHSGWPKEIFYRLMRMFSIEGDTILDPFCGRGNEDTAIENGRNYIGFEIGG